MKLKVKEITTRMTPISATVSGNDIVVDTESVSTVTAIKEFDVAVIPPIPPPTNLPPTVSAGEDQVLVLPLPAPIQTDLHGNVLDDGLPAWGSLTYQWTQLNGPANVFISQPNLLATTLTFMPIPGRYFFRLTVNDGELVAYDEVEVEIEPDPTPPPDPIPVPPGEFIVKSQMDFMQLRRTQFNPGAVINLDNLVEYTMDNEGFRGDTGNKYGAVFCGNATAKLTLRSLPGKRAVIRTSCPFYGCSYLNIKDIDFLNGGGCSVSDVDWVAGQPRPKFTSILNCRFAGPQKKFGFIQLRGDDLWVDGAVIVSEGGSVDGNTNQHHGIYVHAGSRILISNCDVRGTSGYGYHFYEENRIAFDEIAMHHSIGANSRIRSGMICSLGSGGSSSVGFKSMHIHHCEFFGNAQAGAEFTTYGAAIVGPILFEDCVIRGTQGVRNTSSKPIGLTVKHCQLPNNNSVQGGIVYVDNIYGG